MGTLPGSRVIGNGCELKAPVGVGERKVNLKEKASLMEIALKGNR